MTEDRLTGGPRHSRASRFVRLAAVAALGMTLAGCAPAEAPATLTRTFDSPEALANAVLTALAERDQATLLALPLSADEFRTLVWPELPSSRPEANLPVDYAWGDLSTKSRGHLAATLTRWGGTRLELVGLEFTGDTTAYTTFTVRRDPVVIVRAAGGEPQRLQLFGSILERDGRFKLFSYVAD